MTFLEFQNTFKDFPVISYLDIAKLFPGYDRNALTRWQEKGYLTKIRNGYYRLSQNAMTNESDLFFMANHIYSPSYVSLQSALRWYDFIPEGVFLTTSVSTLKTNRFNSKYGNFNYQKIKTKLYFGYQMHSFDRFYYKIASSEKALLDFLYFNSHLQQHDDFYGLRLNEKEIKEKVNWNIWEDYLSIFQSKALAKRAKSLYKFLHQ